MKKFTLWSFGAILVLLGTSQVYAQNSAPEKEIKTIKVTRHTVMEQYEPDMVLSVDERVRLKEERIATIEYRRGILDTVDISDRRRQRLLKELAKNPFSDKLDRAITEIEYVEDEVEN